MGASRQRATSEVRERAAVSSKDRNLAHSLINVLFVVRTSCAHIRSVADDDERITRELDTVEGTIAQATELIRRMLGARRDDRVIDVNEAIEGCLPRLERALGSQIQLQLGLSEVDDVVMDGLELEHIVVNLLVNAREAMPEGGRVSVSTSQRNIDVPRARSLGVEPGRYVVIEVRDTGHGIQENLLERIFEPFVTSKRDGSGRGLGLSSVCDVLQRQGGVLVASSAVGRGASFEVILRAAPAESARASYAC
ncbi:MAG: hypothetical protein KC503_04250 [Myxococcales bacterium]|nr:hypothetical protein [Myxococcales bacterium]